MSLTGLRQVSLPLHGCKVQFRPSAEESSGHNFPPCSGSGFVQDRVRNWKPVPQVTLHFVQFDQLEKPPSTTNKTKHTAYSMIILFYFISFAKKQTNKQTERALAGTPQQLWPITAGPGTKKKLKTRNIKKHSDTRKTTATYNKLLDETRDEHYYILNR